MLRALADARGAEANDVLYRVVQIENRFVAVGAENQIGLNDVDQLCHRRVYAEHG